MLLWSVLFAAVLWFFIQSGMFFGLGSCESIICAVFYPWFLLAQPIAFIPRLILWFTTWIGDLRSFVSVALAVKYLLFVLLGAVPTVVVLKVLQKRIDVELYIRARKYFLTVFVLVVLYFVGSSFYHHDLGSYQAIAVVDRICDGDIVCQDHVLDEGAFSTGNNGLSFPDVRVKTLGEYLPKLSSGYSTAERSRYCDEWGGTYREGVLECRFYVGVVSPEMLTKDDCWTVGDLMLPPVQQGIALTACREQLGFTPITKELLVGSLGEETFIDQWDGRERKRFDLSSFTWDMSLHTVWNELGAMSGRIDDDKQGSSIHIIQTKKEFGKTLVDEEHVYEFHGDPEISGKDDVAILSHKTELVGGVPMRLIELRYEQRQKNGFVVAFEYGDSYMFVATTAFGVGYGDIADSAISVAKRIVEYQPLATVESGN